MTLLFNQILSLSVTASILIVAVVVLRMILKKAPKGLRYAMWAMVGLRLVVPYTFESPFSVMPSHKELSCATAQVSQAIGTTTVEVTQTSHSISVMDVLSCVWIVGAVIMLSYMLISFLRVRLMVRESVLYKDNVYLCDHVNSPFVLGIIKPKIYLNSSISKKDTKLIIAHEHTHIRHLDNLWKPLGFVLLSVYWFNPLCWLSYYLFVKDIELFCDESVVKTLSKNGKKNYSYALLSCSAGKNMVTACPLAFAENSVKTRVRNILSYKKPALYVVVISVILCVATMLMFMTSPVSAKETEDKTDVEPTAVVTEAETQAPTQTEPPTEKKTEPPTEKSTQKPTDPPIEEYDDDSYYDESYYANMNESYVIANAEEYFQKLREETRERINGSNSSSSSSNSNTPKQPQKTVEIPDEIIAWDSSNGMPPDLQ